MSMNDNSGYVGGPIVVTPEMIKDTLRKRGIQLAKGEIDDYFIVKGHIDMCDDKDFVRKLTPQYMRVLFTRIPEIANTGRVSIKKARDAEDRDGWLVTFKAGQRPQRTFTERDLPRLENCWKQKFIREMLKTQPSVADLDGDELIWTMNGIKRFIAVLESHKTTEV